MTLEMIFMPTTPPRKQPMSVYEAAVGDIPPLMRYDLEEGSMLYRAEKSMTPKLRLREADRKALLSWMRQLRYRGTRWTSRSTQMMLAPTTQARRP
jgi:hypothetical protein